MNEAQFISFLSIVQTILVFLAAFNLILVKKRGPRAALMALGILFFAGAIYAFRTKAPEWMMYGAAALGAGSLIADILLHPREKKSLRGKSQ